MLPYRDARLRNPQSTKDRNVPLQHSTLTASSVVCAISLTFPATHWRAFLTRQFVVCLPVIVTRKKQDDVQRKRGWGKFLVQEQPTAVAKTGCNHEGSQLPGYAKPSFYFNLVKALSKNLEGKGSSTH